MKVVKINNFTDVFPLRVTCKRVVDKYGFSYGCEKDFCGSELEVDAADIKKHKWFKYPCFEGIDYGVVCPICKNFIPISMNEIPRTVREACEEFRFNTGNSKVEMD